MHMRISETGIITDGGRPRRWSAADKLRIVEKAMYDTGIATQDNRPFARHGGPMSSPGSARLR